METETAIGRTNNCERVSTLAVKPIPIPVVKMWEIGSSKAKSRKRSNVLLVIDP